MFNAQGEDVVAGTHITEPISVLDERMPALAGELRDYADVLERHYTDVCDIEFTIEQGRLWLLQTRIGKRSPQAALRIAVEMAEDNDFPLTRAESVARVAKLLADPPLAMTPTEIDSPVVATGLGASPGFASGEIATTPDAAVVMAEEGRSVILVRRQTSPDDVHGMARAAGILTSSGGLASHAAVVARGWGIPAVVGASAVSVESDKVMIGDLGLAVGDQITIDGNGGNVYVGFVAGSGRMVPEAATLLGWARELDIEVGQPVEPAPSKREPMAGQRAETGELTADSVLRALLIKGFATPDDFAPALFSTSEEVEATLNRMAADGLVEITGGLFQLTSDGRSLAEEMITLDREQWGEEPAGRALEALVPFDRRMKDIMTGWQMREFKGKQILNDHSDPAHDAFVLEAFTRFHDDAIAWLQSFVDALPRLGSYGSRLRRAAERVADGDTSYLASPRVDSYHTVWFELHEDLIHLAGRTREEEAAAGRA